MYMSIAGGQYKDLFLGLEDGNLPEGAEKELWKYHQKYGALGLGAHWDTAERDLEGGAKHN